MRGFLYILLAILVTGTVPGQSGRAQAQTVTYDDGRAWNDERTQTMSLSFVGGTVTGTIETSTVCKPNLQLWGGMITFSASLLGPWEDRGSVIRGTWAGLIDTCNEFIPVNNGTLEISMASTPQHDVGVRVVLIGVRGPTPYAFYYTPKDRVFVPGPKQSVEVAYHGGQAWRDARTQSARLNFASERVWGDVDTANICTADQALGGVYQRLTATLRGNWEGWGSLIFGTWGGDNLFCNAGPTPDRGHMCVFRGAGPRGEDSIIVHSLDENQQTYSYYYTRFDDKVIDLGLSPAAVAAGGVQSQLLYEGKSWKYGINDGRLQTLAMGIQGDRVFGTINVTSYCTDKASLPGGEYQFEGTLDGPWEGSTVIGWWSGLKNRCVGGTVPDEGTLIIDLGPTPESAAGVRVRLRSLEGLEYAYYHPAKGVVATSFAGPADRFFADAFTLCKFPLPGEPRISEICEYANNGQCDEPDLCPVGTDAEDCRTAGADRWVGPWQGTIKLTSIDIETQIVGMSFSCTDAASCPAILRATLQRMPLKWDEAIFIGLDLNTFAMGAGAIELLIEGIDVSFELAYDPAIKGYRAKMPGMPPEQASASDEQVPALVEDPPGVLRASVTYPGEVSGKIDLELKLNADGSALDLFMRGEASIKDDKGVAEARGTFTHGTIDFAKVQAELEDRFNSKAQPYIDIVKERLSQEQ